ncbi:MAG: TonB-dependent receptor [Cellvibrio sp. 79]|nr:MAG: TonB-dependent receptor [Cellvibrio sp. 79]
MIKTRGITTRKKALVLAIGCALGSVHAYAQQPDTSATDESVEEVIVKGVRASQAKAIDIKRESTTVVDSIVAEDIGKLPDATITDSLQRVTGVQIKREANEGTSLNVRGMPQVMTTLNGEQFLSPWNITDVGANYGDIPAGMINGVDVYKSQSTNAIAGGISGLVNLKTISPLKMKNGFTANAKLDFSQGELSDREMNADGTTDKRSPDDNYSLILGYNNDGLFGVTVGAFQSNSYNANYQMSTSQHLGFLEGKGKGPSDRKDIDGDGDLVNDWYLVPGEYSARSSFMTREREGANISIEAAVGEHFIVRGDAFYTAMDQFDRGVVAAFDGSSSTTSYQVNGTLPQYVDGLYDPLLPVSQGTIVTDMGDVTYVDANGVTQTRNLHTLQVAKLVAPGFQTTSSNQINRTAALNTNFEVEYDSQDRLKAKLRYVYAEAEKQYRSAIFQQGNPGWNWVDVDGPKDPVTGIPAPNGKDPVTGYPLTVDYRGEYPSFSYEGDLSDANLLKFYQGIADGSEVTAELNVIRLDVNYELESDLFSSVDVGFRQGDRDAHNSKFNYLTATQRYPDSDRTPANKRYQLMSGNQVWQRWPDFRYFDYSLENANLVNTGKLPNNGFTAAETIKFTDFGPFKGFESGVSSLNPATWDNPLEFMNRLYPGQETTVTDENGNVTVVPAPGVRTVNDPAFEYDVEEVTSTASFQLNLDSVDGIWGVPFKGNVGAQIISTDRTIQKSIIPEKLDIYNSIGYENQAIAFVSDMETIKYSFVDVLPSINLNFFPTDDVVVRLGAAKTTSRNDLKNLGESLNVWVGECPKYDVNGVQQLGPDGKGETVFCVNGGSDNGDPYMKPWYANVYNATTEWYFDENSILGVGLFMIDVSTSVQTYQEQRRFVDLDGINRGNMANVWASKNVGASSLYGLELGYKQPFTFLPGAFLSATGIEFNYTYSESESTDKDFMGNSFPLRSNSKHQSNMILWYDKAGLNVRLAYNWKSKEYDGRFGLATQAEPISMGNWVEPQGYLDLSASYWLNEHISFTASGTNLTAQSRKSYSQYSNQFNSMWIQERRYNVGITLTL